MVLSLAPFAEHVFTMVVVYLLSSNYGRKIISFTYEKVNIVINFFIGGGGGENFRGGQDSFSIIKVQL